MPHSNKTFKRLLLTLRLGGYIIMLWSMAFLIGRQAHAQSHGSIALPQGTVMRWVQEGVIPREAIITPLQMNTSHSPLSRNEFSAGTHADNVVNAPAVLQPAAHHTPDSPYRPVESQPNLSPSQMTDHTLCAPNNIYPPEGSQNSSEFYQTPTFSQNPSLPPIKPEMLAPVASATASAVRPFPAVNSTEQNSVTPSNTPQPLAPNIADMLRPMQTDTHALDPALRWLRKAIPEAKAKIKDYSCILVKRENVNGRIGNEEYMTAKIRHEPLSIYIRFLRPNSCAGREAIYVNGWNNGRLWAHGTGWEKIAGTLSLEPTGARAMNGNRYPITETGILNLMKRLLEAAERETLYGPCSVDYIKCTLNNRPCIRVEITHQKFHPKQMFHKAHIFVDLEMNVPIRYASWAWPKRNGSESILIEEYTYLNVHVNQGLTDKDYDIKNPDYNF